MFLNDSETFLVRSDHFLCLGDLFCRDAEDGRKPSDYLLSNRENGPHAPEYLLVREEHVLRNQENLLRDEDNLHDV
jgi:hypothetical protein